MIRFCLAHKIYQHNWPACGTLALVSFRNNFKEYGNQMGKLALILTALIAVTGPFVAANEELEKSAFLKIFNELHQDPLATQTPAKRANVQTLWIEQKLDNFDKNETRTWQMVG